MHWEHCFVPLTVGENVFGLARVGQPLLKVGEGGLARGPGVGLSAVGGAHWPLATADPLWARMCFGCVNGAPG